MLVIAVLVKNLAVSLFLNCLPWLIQGHIFIPKPVKLFLVYVGICCLNYKRMDEVKK